MSERRQDIKPPMVSPTLPVFVAYGYGPQRMRTESIEQYLFGSAEQVDRLHPESKYLPAASPPQVAPRFTAIKAGPTSKTLNAPGPTSQRNAGGLGDAYTMYGPGFRRRG